MKSLISGIAVAMLLTVPVIQAQDLDTKTITMAYLSMPFGDTQQESVPVFGFLKSAKLWTHWLEQICSIINVRHC